MTEIRNKIDQILEERLPGTKSEDIADKKVISVGMDSIQMMLFNKSIQDEFKVQIPFSVYFGSTLNEIIQYIAENTDIHENNKAENAVSETVIPDETDEMTDLQYSYWIGSRSERNFGGFMPNICFEARVDGIDVERLETSLNYMIRKHKMLQSAVTDDAMVRAVSYNDYRIRVNDLSEMSEDRQESELKKIRERLKDISYTFNKWPWFTVEYSDLGNGNGVLHIEIELILFDIWSIRIFLEEWYDIYKNGDKNDVPGITYGQYTAYLRNRNSSEQYETDRRYWESRITEFTEPPKLPMKNGGKDFDKRFCHLSYVISDDIWSKLTEKSRIYNVTPTAVLLTAYAKILRKWSENKSFILNMTAFDRDMIHKDMGRLIGEFTNTFLIQAEENKGIRFADEVKENQRQVFEGINHRSYNGIAVLRDIAKERKISPFDCIAPFVFTCALTGDNDYKLNPGENFFGRFEQYSRTPQVLVDCQLFEFDGHLNLVWDYADKVFPDGMISSMYKELIRYLEKIADSSWDGAVDYILSDKICAGYKKLNDTADTEMNTGLMFSDFIRISEKNPDRTAVVSGNVRITYGQLRKSAFVIAEKLSDMGVKAGDAVLIHTERGWKEIVSALGILIAGGAYVGVRKNDSTERKQLIAEKCGAAVIITDTASMGICKSELLIGDEYIKAAPVSEQKIKGHIADIRKDSLAYVIFTSGSTGEPKGVQITHESAMNTIYAVNRKFEIGQSDAVIAISALQFDLSVYDIFGMLSSGGKIVTVPSERKSDPEFWLELAEKENITVWNSVPALFEMLVETMELHKKGYHFRKVLLSGDWIPLDLPKRYWKFCTEADIYSLGGATEASIWSNYYPVKYIDENWKSIPYGYPLENQTMYVLDNELVLCPPYVEGDIYIGGKGTALGYIGDKEKTDAVFITQHESGERIYKTGDRGYLSDEGYIVFMGRNDRQIKLNGYRMELDEIRNVIESVSGVKKAIVVKKTAGSGNAVLAAYYVRKAEESDGAGKITASDVPLLTSFE